MMRGQRLQERTRLTDFSSKWCTKRANYRHIIYAIKIQSTTRTTEFFVVGILSVILVKFAILVGTKSLEETVLLPLKGEKHSIV